MTDQSSKVPVSKSETREVEKTPEGELQETMLPDVKVETAGETGYSSAPHSSDVMSGPEGTVESVWTSDDHGPQMLTLRPSPEGRESYKRKSPKKYVVDSGSTSKSGAEEFEDKTLRLRSRKKLSPSKQMIAEASMQSLSVAIQSSESDDEETSRLRSRKRLSPSKQLIAESSVQSFSTVIQCSESDAETSPTKRKLAEGKSLDKSKSVGKTSSSKIKPSRKKTELSSAKSSSTFDPGMAPQSAVIKGAKEKSKSPSKAFKTGLSIFSSKQKGVAKSSKTCEEGSKTEKPEECKSPQKSKSSGHTMLSKLIHLGKKSPSKKKSSTSKESSVPEPTESGTRSSPKSKKVTRSLFGKSKSPSKRGAAVSSQKTEILLIEEQLPSVSHHSTVSTTDLAKHVKKVDISGLQYEKGSDKVPLTEEAMEISDLEYTREKTARFEERLLLPKEESSEKRTHWYSLNIFQSDFLHQDVTYFSSSTDDTPTELSTVSDSSGIHGGSESKKGSVSSDSLSHISGPEEQLVEPEPKGGASVLQEEEGSRPIQGIKRINVESVESDEETKAFQSVGSPSKKMPLQRQDALDTE